MVIGVTSDGVEKPMCLDAAEYYDKQRIGPALGGGALAGSINGDVRGYQTAEERYADQAEKSRPD